MALTGQELRIGNIVLFMQDDTVFTVNSIDDLGIGVQNEVENTWIEIGEFEAIELDFEWIKKFKFSQNYTTDPQEQNPSEIFCIDEFALHLVGGQLPFRFFSYENLVSEVEFVHQLQNLFFCLTGKELTLKSE